MVGNGPSLTAVCSICGITSITPLLLDRALNLIRLPLAMEPAARETLKFNLNYPAELVKIERKKKNLLFFQSWLRLRIKKQLFRLPTLPKFSGNTSMMTRSWWNSWNLLGRHGASSCSPERVKLWLQLTQPMQPITVCWFSHTDFNIPLLTKQNDFDDKSVKKAFALSTFAWLKSRESKWVQGGWTRRQVWCLSLSQKRSPQTQTDPNWIVS